VAFQGRRQVREPRCLKGSTKRPDILIAEPHVSPVIVETEIAPAVSVEADARQRLGAPGGLRSANTVLSRGKATAEIP
jgi:hypothetical protein